MEKQTISKQQPIKKNNKQKDDTIVVFGRPRYALAKKLKLNLRFPRFVISEHFDIESPKMEPWHLRLPTQVELEHNKDGFICLFSDDMIHPKEEYIQGRYGYIHTALWNEIQKKFSAELTARDAMNLCIEFFKVQGSIAIPKCFSISTTNKKRAA